MKTPTLYVIARYSVDRAYGGPEEGGWWYTCGELEKVVLATRNPEWAFYAVRRLNDTRADMNRMEVAYQIVEVPRYEVVDELESQLCHLDADLSDDDYEWKWDIPTYYPEGRPHYC